MTNTLPPSIKKRALGDMDPDAAGAQEERELARAAKSMRWGLGHTYLILVAVCGGLMALSPVLNRGLEAWQGIVVYRPETGPVEILKANGMLIERGIREDLRRGFVAGTFLRKQSLSWNPEVVTEDVIQEDPKITDPALQPRPFLASRSKTYRAAWLGSVVAIHTQKLPTRGEGMGEITEKSTMELALDSGATLSLPVSASLLGKLAVGVRLEKQARQWEPRVLPAEQAPAPSP